MKGNVLLEITFKIINRSTFKRLYICMEHLLVTLYVYITLYFRLIWSFVFPGSLWFSWPCTVTLFYPLNRFIYLFIFYSHRFTSSSCGFFGVFFFPRLVPGLLVFPLQRGCFGNGHVSELSRDTDRFVHHWIKKADKSWAIVDLVIQLILSYFVGTSSKILRTA